MSLLISISRLVITKLHQIHAFHTTLYNEDNGMGQISKQLVEAWKTSAAATIGETEE